MHTLLSLNSSPTGACLTQTNNIDVRSSQQNNITKKSPPQQQQQQSVITKFISNNNRPNTIIVPKRAMYKPVPVIPRATTTTAATKQHQQHMLYHQHGCSLLIHLLIALSLVLMSCTFTVYTAPPNDVVSALKKMKIYPDLVSTLPDNVVTFNVGNKKVKAGDHVSPQDLKQMPTGVSWGQPSSDTLSTLMMLDVDRHQKSNNNSINGYVIWTQVNVPGEMLAGGWPIVRYSTPASLCSATGVPHRLVVLAYHQRQPFEMTNVLNLLSINSDPKSREDFRLNEFISQYGLTLEAITAVYAQGAGLCSASSPSTVMSAYMVWISTLVSIGCMLLLRRSVHR